MSTTTYSRVFPVSSLVSIDSVPISIRSSRKTSPVRPRTERRSTFHNCPAVNPRTVPASTSHVSVLEEDQQCHDPCVIDSIQGFGAAVGLQQDADDNLLVSVASDNTKAILGYSPSELFALQNFCHVLEEHESEAFIDHIAAARRRATYSSTLNVFNMSIRIPGGSENCFSCVIHANLSTPSVVLCEFVPQDPHHSACPFPYRPRTLRTRSRRATETTPVRPSFRRSESATDATETISRAQGIISAASTMEALLQSLVTSIKNATGHEDVYVHRFDDHYKGRLLAYSDKDGRYDYSADLSSSESCSLSAECQQVFEGLEVQVHQDRQTARLINRPDGMLERPSKASLCMRVTPDFFAHGLDERHARSRVLVPLMVWGKLWGLVTGYSFAPTQTPITFLSRSVCRFVADSASRRIENMMTSRTLDSHDSLTRDLTLAKDSTLGFPGPRDMLSSLQADFAISVIDGMKKFVGHARAPQEGLALVEYLRLRKLTDNFTSVDFVADFPDLHYRPGFQIIKKLLFISLGSDGEDFVVFFRASHTDPSHPGLEPWDEADLQNAAVIRTLSYALSPVWKAKENALEENRLYRLLLSNSSHEFRTLLNAISNYLEFASEGKLNDKASEVVMTAKATSQALLVAVTKLLDCVEQGLES